MPSENTPPHNEELAINLQYNVVMTEYNMVRELVGDSRKTQSQLDNFALAGLGLSIPLVLAILEQNPNVIGAILLIPILFFIIAFTQLRHERMLILSAVYADSNLAPKIRLLITKLATPQVSLFEFDSFLAKNSWVPNLFLEWLANLSRTAISLAAGLGLIVIYFFLKVTVGPTSWESYELVLLFVNLLLLMGDAFIAYRVGITRHNYLSEHGYFETQADVSKDDIDTRSSKPKNSEEFPEDSSE